LFIEVPRRSRQFSGVRQKRANASSVGRILTAEYVVPTVRSITFVCSGEIISE
jgi:hypothetical protein